LFELNYFLSRQSIVHDYRIPFAISRYLKCYGNVTQVGRLTQRCLASFENVSLPSHDFIHSS